MLENRNKVKLYQSYSEEPSSVPNYCKFIDLTKGENEMSDIGRIEYIFNQENGEYNYIKTYNEIKTDEDDILNEFTIVDETMGWIPYYVKYIVYEPVYQNTKYKKISYYIKYAVTAENFNAFLSDYVKSDSINSLIIYYYTGNQIEKNTQIYQKNNWTRSYLI